MNINKMIEELLKQIIILRGNLYIRIVISHNFAQ